MAQMFMRGIPDLGRLATNKSFQKDLKTFLQMDDALRQAVVDLSKTHADYFDEDVVKDAAAAHGVSVEDVLENLVVALVVRRSVDSDRRSADDSMALLREAADGDDEFARLVASSEPFLREMMKITDEDQLDAWTHEALASFLPRLVDIEATWEIRPVANSEGKAVDFVPLVILRLESHSPGDTGEMVVQLDARALSKLRSVLSRLDENEEAIADCCRRLCSTPKASE
ncbi:MAG: hypothetical protein KGZ40_07090 [Clostridiales bacterium]|nr:hypothetical protein [Clostridiales bacterium]